MDKPPYHVVSLSGGKDSTAMLLKMIERRMPIDCILFCDTGLEFPAMYDHIDQLERDIGRHITRVKCGESFEYLMLETPVKRTETSKLIQKLGYNPLGYGWAGPKMRWCTSKLKDIPRDQFFKPLRKEYTVFEYIGIAADEGYRLKRQRNQRVNHKHPLVDWGMTEKQCLDYCYGRGYHWGGLYEHFKRVSCWCCPLQPLPELRQLYKYYPELWEKLMDWDNRNWRQFRKDYSVEELNIRFKLEEQRLADGLSIRGKAFFNALRWELGEKVNG